MAIAAIWVGLGGYTVGSNALEQTGTAADCNGAGKATYYAWYELVPASSVTLKLKIFPGGSHALGDTSKEQLNEELLAFVRS